MNTGHKQCLCIFMQCLRSVYAVFDTVHFRYNKSKLSSSTQVEDVEIGLLR